MQLSVPRAFLPLLAACAVEAGAQPGVAPGTLAETGVADLPVRAFAPQYPLWTDGAAKQRWIHLPGAIDAAGAWQFPAGTKLWKQFAVAGEVAETRYMEHTEAGWLYATYDHDGALVDRRGATSPIAGHALPSEGECRACHANGPTPVLGFSALQLSTDRDPSAVHGAAPPAGAIDLRELLERGLLANAPPALVVPPRIPGAAIERAALGYLHGNCSGCHRRGGALDALGLFLDAESAIATTVDRASSFAPAGMAPVRIVPGHPERSVLLARVRSRQPAAQMPPIGTRLVDDEAVTILHTWITNLEERQ